MISAFVLVSLPLLAAFTGASPLFGIGQIESTGTPTPETAQAITAITPIANFAEQAYCPLASVVSQTCGGNCLANPGVSVLTSGGDGGTIPQFFVAHDPTSQSIIVSHQGTDPANILSVINDVETFLVPINTTLFPLAPSGVEVHDGFQQTFERTSSQVLAGVMQGLSTFKVSTVQVTGHSLGAALAILDSVFLSQALGPAVHIKTTVFGLPRAGNQDWANLVDATLTGVIHMHNKNDIVPTIPPRDLDFQHPSGEVFIEVSNNTVACPGQENINCSLGNSLLDVVIADHFGPYAGVLMGTASCLISTTA